MDAGSEAFLDTLIDGLPTARALVVVTYRPEYEERWSQKRYHSLLRLDPLSGETADGFLEALLGDDTSIRPRSGCSSPAPRATLSSSRRAYRRWSRRRC